MVNWIAVAAALLSPAFALWIVKIKSSGRINTTEASDLWQESKSIREELRDEVAELQREIGQLRIENQTMEAEINELKMENLILKNEIRILTLENGSLRKKLESNT